MVMCAVVVMGGCDGAANEDGLRAVGGAEAATVSEPVWKQVREATVAEVSEPAVLKRLDEARAKAMETIDQARLRWQNSPESERAKWSVKWAAGLAGAIASDSVITADGDVDPDSVGDDGAEAGGGIEYVWVVPVNWSAFRIEGVIANAPTRPLACGKGQGDIVSFAASEVTDWMFLPTGRFEDGYEGGYSIKALEGAAE